MKNVRDMGYDNIKKGTIFRGGALNESSRKDSKFLSSNRITTVIDLRTDEEQKKEKDIIPSGVKFISIPLITKEELVNNVVKHDGSGMPDMFAYYRIIVGKNKQSEWAKIFDTLLSNDGAIYYHCTAGKDRTGIVSAVVLKALGMSDSVIYHDYLLTNKNVKIPFSYKWHFLFMKKDQKNAIKDLFFVKRDYLLEAFKEIDKVYGSFDKFLAECCLLDEVKMTKLKAKYLVR